MPDKILDKVMSGEPVKVLVTQDISHGYLFPCFENLLDNKVVIGEADVIFKLEDNEKATQDAVEILDQKIQRTYAEAERQVGLIKDQKARLLSLTHKE